MCVTDRHDMTLAVIVALNPNTTNQPSTGVRKPGNTVMCITDRHDMTLAVKVALNLNTTNQSSVCPLQSYSFQNEVQVARLLYPLFTFCLILKHIFTTSDQHLDRASEKKKEDFHFYNIHHTSTHDKDLFGRVVKTRDCVAKCQTKKGHEHFISKKDKHLGNLEFGGQL